MNPENGKKMIEAYVSQLSEHFESVQILVSFPWENGTQPLYSGRGNWFSRQGMAQDFIKQDERKELAEEIARTSEI